MKKKLFFIIQICIVLFAVNIFYSCNDTVTGSGDEMRGVSVVPNPMTIGQKISISGPNFKDATAIVFPGGVSVSDFTRAGDFQLNAIVPSGAASEGKISVTLPGGAFVIPIDVIILSTRDLLATSMDKNPTNGNYWVGPNDKLTVRGEGLGLITEIILPGDLSIKSMNFDKKTDSTIEISIPMGGFDRKAVEPLKLISVNGQVLYTANKLDWSGEGFVPPELLLLCGRSFKVWSWDEEIPSRVFGNGGYGSDPGPAWWVPGVTQFNGTGHELGAKMAFYLPNRMELTLANGTVYKGKFSTDMTKGVGTWSSGKLEVVAGDDQLSIVGGTFDNYNGPTKIYPKIFDFVKLTNGEMTLAFQYPTETTTANFYVYRVREDEGEGSGGGAVVIPDDYKPFVGEGSKTWTWDDSYPKCYGMGDGKNETYPTWWSAPGGKEFMTGEGLGATMTLSYGGKGNIKLTKNKTNGDTETGSWILDMSARYSAGWSRAIGKFTTDKITVLSGRGGANTDVFEYWVLKITDDQITLGICEEADGWSFDQEGWGTANLWLFKVHKEE